MSLSAFFMWFLTLLGISNGPCGPNHLTGVGIGADQCSGPPPSAATAKSDGASAAATGPGTSPNLVDGGPGDDISNGF